MKIVDCHSHSTEYSFDALQTIAELIEDARQKNLGGVCLTDHYDKDVSYSTGVEVIFNLPEYFDQLRQIRSQQKLTDPQLLIGIELGWMPYLTPLYNQIAAQWPFDSVILSLHMMDDKKDIFLDQSIYDQGINAAYSRALIQMVEMMSSCPDFNILGHFDYVSRYVPGRPVRMEYHRLAQEFDAVFAYLIANNKSIELNTRTALKLSHLGLTGDAIWPDPQIFQRYLEMGGKLISLSSDAHEVGQAGLLFDEAVQYLVKLGVTHLTHFVSRQPVLTAITASK